MPSFKRRPKPPITIRHCTIVQKNCIRFLSNIGTVGKITGDADINISFMHLSRLNPRGQALMILALDEPLSKEQQQQILSLPDVYSTKLVKL